MAGGSDIFILLQKLTKERAPQVGFLISFVAFISTHVSWLIILPPSVGCDIMGCESDPLPYYTELRNCFYSFTLNYTDSPSTTQVRLPCPGTTISSSGSYLVSAPLWCRVHK